MCVYREDLLSLYTPHCGHQKSVRNNADRVPKASFLGVRDLVTLSLGQEKAVSCSKDKIHRGRGHQEGLFVLLF